MELINGNTKLRIKVWMSGNTIRTLADEYNIVVLHQEYNNYVDGEQYYIDDENGKNLIISKYVECDSIIPRDYHSYFVTDTKEELLKLRLAQYFKLKSNES
jgi:hypothetical protein